MEKSVKTLEEFEAEAIHFAKELSPRNGKATLILLSGELGAGKTAFTKAVAQTLGVEEIVNSPTFVLEKIYKLPKENSFKNFIHIDAYRLESGDDLTPLGFDELLQDSGNLIFFEWPEKVVEALLEPAKHISFAVRHDGSRTISYD